MKKLFLLFWLSIFLFSNALAQSYAKNLRCESAAHRSFAQNHEICAKREGIEYFRCKMEMWDAFRGATCSNYARASSSNQIFLHKIMISNYEDAWNGKITDDLALQRIKQLIKLSKEENEQMNSYIDKELDDLEESRARQRNFDFYSQAVKILGGTVRSENVNSGFSTYIINGRVINCSRMGAFVNCN
jgi:hypothetical protein